MSKARRQAKAIKRQAFIRKRMAKNSKWRPRCLNCGQRDTHGHYVPPSLGDRGMWTCEKADLTDEERAAIVKEMFGVKR